MTLKTGLPFAPGRLIATRRRGVLCALLLGAAAVFAGPTSPASAQGRRTH